MGNCLHNLITPLDMVFVCFAHSSAPNPPPPLPAGLTEDIGQHSPPRPLLLHTEPFTISDDSRLNNAHDTSRCAAG